MYTGVADSTECSQIGYVILAAETPGHQMVDLQLNLPERDAVLVTNWWPSALVTVLALMIVPSHNLAYQCGIHFSVSARRCASCVSRNRIAWRITSLVRIVP